MKEEKKYSEKEISSWDAYVKTAATRFNVNYEEEPASREFLNFKSKAIVKYFDTTPVYIEGTPLTTLAGYSSLYTVSVGSHIWEFNSEEYLYTEALSHKTVVALAFKLFTSLT